MQAHRPMITCVIAYIEKSLLYAATRGNTCFDLFCCQIYGQLMRLSTILCGHNSILQDFTQPFIGSSFTSLF